MMLIGKRCSAVLILLAVTLVLCVSCDRYARYQALSFVFDGVPHPDDPPLISDTMTPQRRVPGKVYQHPEGVDKRNKCAICHGSISKMEMPPADICLVCHSEVVKANFFIHGPAAINCVACHDVHKSDKKTLVRKTDPELCFDCHYTKNSQNMYEPDGHQTLREGSMVCLPCHDPHGGRDRFFIKADASLTEAAVVKDPGVRTEHLEN